MTILPRAAALAVAAALAFSATPSSAAALGGRCDGQIDVACTFCSYLGGPDPQPEYKCARPDLYPGYVTRACLLWGNGRCTH